MDQLCFGQVVLHFNGNHAFEECVTKIWEFLAKFLFWPELDFIMIFFSSSVYYPYGYISPSLLVHFGAVLADLVKF